MLLTEYTEFKFSQAQIQESIQQNNGKLIVSGILQKWGEKNHNGRIYPKTVMLRETEKYQQKIKEGRALGELDHPEDPVISLSNVSHRVIEMWVKDHGIYGKLEVLGTPSGNILKELFLAGIPVGISSRGLGSLKKIDEDTTEVQEDFDLVCYDVVSDPSTHGAFLSKLNEHKIYSLNNSKINSLIREILSEEN